MRMRSIDVLRGGEILAKPILSDEQDIIVPKGTILKTEYIPLIQSMGISSVFVEVSGNEQMHFNIGEQRYKEYVSKIRKIMEGHIHQSNTSLKQCEVIANEILKDVLELSCEQYIFPQEFPSDLYEHTIRVTLLSLFIARKMQLDKQRLYNVALGCLLHDIGIRYITAPYKEVNLRDMDAASVFELKKHTILGYSALDGESWLPAISKKMILAHHEKSDASGYPMRLQYKETECKIIQVCDAFDRYLSGMECKRVSTEQAIEKMKKYAGIRYDQKVVDILLKMIDSTFEETNMDVG